MRTVRVLRWRLAQKGLHSPSISVEDLRPIRLTANAARDVHVRVSQRGNEPTGHELFREAWEERNHNPEAPLFLWNDP